jgi:hypothetical protein
LNVQKVLMDCMPSKLSGELAKKSVPLYGIVCIAF